MQQKITDHYTQQHYATQTTKGETDIMKRIAVTIAALLALTLAVPAVAAPNINVGGTLESKLQLAENGVSGTSDLRLKLGMSLGSGDRLKAVVEFVPLEWAPFARPEPAEGSINADPQPMGNNTTKPIDLVNQLKIKKAYIQSVGPFWPGGQDVTTTLGDLAIDYSPYVASRNTTDARLEGVSIEGARVGPAELAAFYSWDGEKSRTVARGASARAAFGMFEGTGAVVQSGQDLAYVGTLTVKPVENLKVTGTYARDEANEASVRRVDAEIASLPLLPELTLKVGYRDFDPNFKPAYRDMSTDDDGTPIEPNVVGLNEGQVGVKAEAKAAVRGIELRGGVDQYKDRIRNNDVRILTAGAGTTIQGVKVSGDYEVKTTTPAADPENPTKDTKLTLGAETNIPMGPLAVNASYKATLENQGPTMHRFAAVTEVPVPVLGAVDLSGKFMLKGQQSGSLLTAGYTAPNGINLAVNYKDKNYVPEDDEDIKGIADGLSLTGGVKVEF